MKKTIAVATLVLSAILLGANTAHAERSYYKVRDWSAKRMGSVHISPMIYRDIDRDGTYSMGDLPQAKIVVEMTTPSGRRIVKRSNLSGYANFSATAKNNCNEICEPGLHKFKVVPPPGYEVSSGNEIQEIEIIARPDARGSFIGIPPAATVGIRPKLTISGPAESTITLTSEDGDEISVAPAGDWFSASVIPGYWRVNRNSEEEPILVKVGSYPVTLSGGAHNIKLDPEELQKLTFDDLITHQDLTEIPNGYGRLKWTNFISTHSRLYKGEGYINNLVSGDYVLYNSSGHPAEIYNDVPFDFIGGHFGVAWYNQAEGETLNIRAWKGQDLVAEDKIALSSFGPVYFLANYESITRLEFETEHYWQMVADDLTFVVR